MSATDPRHPDGAARAVLLTSYGTGATRGKNLGTPGYSYDIVAALFVPLLERWGEVVPVGRDSRELDAAARAARLRGMRPIHVSVLPFQDICLSSEAPNVIVPAWEFPDIPDHAFDGNPQNNWVAVSEQCDLVIVGGPYTVASFRRGGIRKPIYVVPVPTPLSYFDLPRWQYGATTLLGCNAYVFSHDGTDLEETAAEAATPLARSRLRAFLRTRARLAYRHGIKPLLPPAVHTALRGAARSLASRALDPFGRQHRKPYVELSGVVYTSIFNPGDGRKNWEDLLSGFLKALGDCPDATLVFKLITKNPQWLERVAGYYRCLDRRHRCRVVFLTDYLSEQQMLDLCQASTYYITTTRAEGNCLPVMNYLAAGRPVLSPCHSAISDYFSERIGFVLETHPEPAIWPHDSSLRFKTTWGRLVWPSLLEQLRHSYETARGAAASYEDLAAAGREKMNGWAYPEAVWQRLRTALEAAETLPVAPARAA
jgi:glycosyltransferase involved in cell wall biosynthesis